MLKEENLLLKSGRYCGRWLSLYYHKASFLMLGWRELSYSSSLILCVRGVELIIKYPSIYSLLKDDTLFFSSQNADTADPFHCLAQL